MLLNHLWPLTAEELPGFLPPRTEKRVWYCRYALVTPPGNTLIHLESLPNLQQYLFYLFGQSFTKNNWKNWIKSNIHLFADGIICRISPLFSLLIWKTERNQWFKKLRLAVRSWYMRLYMLPSFFRLVHPSRLTGRGERRLHFRSRRHWLNWSGLFGSKFLQADSSLLEHLLDGALLLENFLHLVLMEIKPNQAFCSSTELSSKYHLKMWLKFSEKHVFNLLNLFPTDPELSSEHCLVLAAHGTAVSEGV